MDLFDDLPEPGTKKSNLDVSKTIPPERKFGAHSCEIFSDLPPPTPQPEKIISKRKIEDSEMTPLQLKKTKLALCELRGFVAEKKGEREEMQDAHIVIDDYKKHIPQLNSFVSRLSLYGVFDGHGGARASRFTAVHLPQILANSLLKVDPLQAEKDMKRAMLETFKKTEEVFLKEATKTKPSWKDGTTAIVVLAVDNCLYISNIGDSKAILCRYNKETKKHSAIPLSKDHSPTDYMERMRIQRAGGFVRDGRVMGTLEVSRSIGDGQYKALGVTCVPDVKRCQLIPDDLFILLACDGLWKVFTSDEVVKIVLSSTKVKTTEGVKIEGEAICFETACSRLVSEAIRRQSGDNVTVVIVSIKEAT